MSIVIGTLCLNEMEWLPLLYEQHKNWPDLVKWVFVESADRQYANANPEMVSSSGLSTDNTSDYLRDLAKSDDRVEYYPLGFSSHPDPAQGKCQARQIYLDVAHQVSPKIILTLDADEFYACEDQKMISYKLYRIHRSHCGFVTPYFNVWHPPSIHDQPLFSWEIIGKLWGVRVCKFWSYRVGMCYSNNHNAPMTQQGVCMNKDMRIRGNATSGNPGFVHMGFASMLSTRRAKNRYYVERGEGRTDHRGSYVTSRAAFETWKPSDRLPNRDRLIPFNHPIPEIFSNDQHN